MPQYMHDQLMRVHLGIAMEIQKFAYSVNAGKRLLVVGSGMGQMARLAAWCFEAGELHLVDFKVEPDEFEAFCPETFYKLDVLSDTFIEQIIGKVDVILCFMTVHELADPQKGICNILKVLPVQQGCFAWFMDISAYRWQQQKAEGLSAVPEEWAEHVRADLANVERYGLDDQDVVYSLYEAAVAEAGHASWGKQILRGDDGSSQDIYEVTVGIFD